MRFLKANSLFNGEKFLPGDTVLVLDDSDLLQDIVHENDVEQGNIERFEGIVTPGFVNVHCHLELSHLKNRIPQHTGLPGFAKQVIVQRGNFSPEDMAERMQAADLEMLQNGIVAVGDISNGDSSFATKANSRLFYHTFIELIGLDPLRSELIFNKGTEMLQALKNHNLHGSLAPHAPYSTSTELIKAIADYNKKTAVPFTIHNQESQEETRFFNGRENGFNELFSFLGLDISWFKAPGVTSLQSYVNVLTEKPSVLVHNTFTSAADLAAAASKNIFWCFCPGANLYIENSLPDFNLFKGQEHKICFGTDSLASNTQLDVIAEANLVLKNTAVFSTETILSSLTSNAAKALNIQDNFGNFIIGKNAGLNLISLKNEQLQFIKKIV